jgi:hypothetical protein
LGAWVYADITYLILFMKYWDNWDKFQLRNSSQNVYYFSMFWTPGSVWIPSKIGK